MEIQISFKLSLTGFADSVASATKKAKQFTMSTAKFAMRPAIALMKEIDIQMTAAAMRNASRALLLEADANRLYAQNATSNTQETAHE